MAARKEEKEAPGRAAEKAAEESVRAGSEMGERSRRMAEGGLAQAAEMGRQSTEQMRNLAAVSARAYRELTDFSRDDVDALVQSSARLAKGMQDMTWEVVQYTQNSMRMSMQVANSIMGCRSVEDMMQVQRDFMRESVDSFLQESAKLLEMTSSVTNEAVSPINERVQEGARH